MIERQRNSIGVILLACFLLAIDRMTKYYAFSYLHYPWVINPYLAFSLSLNRGISWGILSFSNNQLFALLTLCIIAIAGIVAWYAWTQWQRGTVPLGEILVLVGACSNIVDRVLYGAVIDFILLSYDAWSFPIFNIADVCIVVGAGLMVISGLQEP